jgi:hypothetical protein
VSAAPEPRSSQYISFFVGGDELASQGEPAGAGALGAGEGRPRPSP